MKKLIFLWMIFCTAVFASDSSRTLRISTWPAGAEIYLGERPQSFVQSSDMFTPDSIFIVNENKAIRVTLFKPGYRDTTINIHTKSPEKNFIWIELQEETDLNRLEWQESILGERENKRTGKILFGVGSVPFILSGVFAVVAEKQFQNAKNTRDKIESSLIQDVDHFETLEKQFDDSKHSGKHYRTAALISLGISAVLFTAAAIFYF